MEKFKKFADPQTGLNPFLPVKVDVTHLGKIIGFILTPIRLVILGGILSIIYVT